MLYKWFILQTVFRYSWDWASIWNQSLLPSIQCTASFPLPSVTILSITNTRSYSSYLISKYPTADNRSIYLARFVSTIVAIHAFKVFFYSRHLLYFHYRYRVDYEVKILIIDINSLVPNSLIAISALQHGIFIACGMPRSQFVLATTLPAEYLVAI